MLDFIYNIRKKGGYIGIHGLIEKEKKLRESLERIKVFGNLIDSLLKK